MNSLMNKSSIKSQSDQLTQQDLQHFDNQSIFAFTSQPDEILDLFQTIAVQLGFDMIEKQPTHATAIKKPKQKQGMLEIMNCFGWFHVEQVTAVKIALSKSLSKGTLKEIQIAKIRGLVGNPLDIQRYLQHFKLKITQIQQEEAPQIFFVNEDEDISLQNTDNQNPFYLEACSYHLINKLILNDEYPIYKQSQKMLSDFSNNFKNLFESISVIPLPMKNTISIVNQMCNHLEKVLTDLKYPNQIMLFARIAVQQYVFNKVQAQLFAIYRLKNLDIDTNFYKKRKVIIETYTIREILSEVCLNQKFWSINMKKIDDLLDIKEGRKQIYFCSACRQLQKIVFSNSPRQKIKYCQLAYTELKMHFFDFSKGKYQLASMEDIIPILIIVILFSEVSDLRSQFDIMNDFISFDPNEMEAEKRLVINFSESYNYIWRDWALKS